MSYGLSLERHKDFPSKKAVRDLLADGHDENVILYNTSLFGENVGFREYLGYVPDGDYDFVGPNPYTDRRFYGTLTVKTDEDGNRSYKVK